MEKVVDWSAMLFDELGKIETERQAILTAEASATQDLQHTKRKIEVLRELLRLEGVELAVEPIICAER